MKVWFKSCPANGSEWLEASSSETRGLDDQDDLFLKLCECAARHRWKFVSCRTNYGKQVFRIDIVYGVDQSSVHASYYIKADATLTQQQVDFLLNTFPPVERQATIGQIVFDPDYQPPDHRLPIEL